MFPDTDWLKGSVRHHSLNKRSEATLVGVLTVHMQIKMMPLILAVLYSGVTETADSSYEEAE